MAEIDLQPETFTLLAEFKPVYAEITGEDPDQLKPDDFAVAVVVNGLRSMVADFFRRLDEETQLRSIALFHEQYPFTQLPQFSDAALADSFGDLALRYPTQFFEFMLRTLRESKAAAAREQWARLFT